MNETVLKQLANINKYRDEIEQARRTRLTNYVDQLPEKQQTHASLLLPTFTGWPSELADVLDNLETKPKLMRTQCKN